MRKSSETMFEPVKRVVCLGLKGASRLVMVAAATSCLMSGLLWADGESHDVVSTGNVPGIQQSAVASSVSAKQEDGPCFRVSEFVPCYGSEHVDLPSCESLCQISVNLINTPTGYIAPCNGNPGSPVCLADVKTGSQQNFHASALQKVVEAVVKCFHDQGIAGVYVSAHPQDLSDAGRDLRSGRSDLRIQILAPTIAEIHTVSTGKNIAEGSRVDHPKHQKIAEKSPVGVGGLILKDKLEDYLYMLNRHPGRRVNLTLAPPDDCDSCCAKVDYSVCEEKPWTAWFMFANTGATGLKPFRESFGFRHNQLTGNDDILYIDYTTAGFSESHSVTGYYESPPLFFECDGLRFRSGAHYSQYRGTDFGNIADVNVDFKGKSFGSYSEVIYNIYQKCALFVDIFGGMRTNRIFVRNWTNDIEGPGGREIFMIPYVGARLEQFMENYSTTGEIKVETNVTHAAQENIDKLGRSGAEDTFTKFQYCVRHAHFLDNLFSCLSDCDPCQTRAHQIELGLWGQFSWDDQRLIPQEMMPIGGMYTVRGYPDAFTSGDNVIVGSAEYRFYMSRMITPCDVEPSKVFGRTFRWSPDAPCGRADWDLVLCTYTDVARSTHEDRLGNLEKNNTLWGAGIGVELLIWDNFRLRGDWAWALKGALSAEDGERVHGGESRGHITGSIFY
jgi:hemolysin activation/secretion protein